MLCASLISFSNYHPVQQHCKCLYFESVMEYLSSTMWMPLIQLLGSPSPCIQHDCPVYVDAYVCMYYLLFPSPGTFVVRRKLTGEHLIMPEIFILDVEISSSFLLSWSRNLITVDLLSFRWLRTTARVYIRPRKLEMRRKNTHLEIEQHVPNESCEYRSLSYCQFEICQLLATQSK